MVYGQFLQPGVGHLPLVFVAWRLEHGDVVGFEVGDVLVGPLDDHYLIEYHAPLPVLPHAAKAADALPYVDKVAAQEKEVNAGYLVGAKYEMNHGSDQKKGDAAIYRTPPTCNPKEDRGQQHQSIVPPTSLNVKS